MVSARLNLSHGTIGVGEFVIYSVLSHHNKNLRQLTDQHYTLGWTSVKALGQTSVTAQYYNSVLFKK